LLSSFIGSIAQEMAEGPPRSAARGSDAHPPIYDDQSRMLLVTIEHFAHLLKQNRGR